MAAEVWALVGVVVGALLGGGAQVVAGHLEARRAHTRWLRERRAEIYQEFLVLWDSYYVEATKLLKKDAPVQLDPEDHLVPLLNMGTKVGMFGTDAANDAAFEATHQLGYWMECPPEARARVEAKVDQARVAVMRQIRRDLGLPE